MIKPDDKKPAKPAPDAVRFAIVKIAKFYEPLTDEERGRVDAAIRAMFPTKGGA